jgi:hypothetical protein
MTEPTKPPDQPSPPPQPAWRSSRARGQNGPSIVVGLIFVAIGVWYFLDQTLGLDMPRINWRDFWPVILIFLGGVIVFRSVGRRT